jgi:hypothetical protein
VTPAISVMPALKAVRSTRGFYPGDQKGRAAVDGSLLDRAAHTVDGRIYYAWATTWREGCGCFKPPTRRLVPSERLYCHDHGRLPVPSDDPYPMSSEERSAVEDRVWPRLAARVGIPNRYRLVRLEGGEPTPALLAVREFLQDERNDERCLVLAGPTGVGKTYAIIAGFREAAIWNCDGALSVYFGMSALARALLDEDDREEVLEQCLEADLLAIDDVGGAYVKAGGLIETLFEEILVDREGNQLQTMLTTNLTLESFADTVGDRIADRVRGSWGTWCSLPGSSLRRKRAGRRG